MNMNECRALSFTANPNKFLNADIFCFVEPRACGPPLSVGSIGWISQVKVHVHSSKNGAVPIYRSRSGAKTNTPATYCTGPSTRHSTRNQPPLYCARTVERPPASNFRTVHRYIFILRTWSNFKTLRGLVRKKSVLFGKTLLNKAKKRECSTGTTANKDRNYIDNCSSLSPALRRTVWRPERKTTSPSRRWCQWEQLEYPPLTFFCR